jgi:hypothetical protein
MASTGNLLFELISLHFQARTFGTLMDKAPTPTLLPCVTAALGMASMELSGEVKSNSGNSADSGACGAGITLSPLLPVQLRCKGVNPLLGAH